MKLASFDMVARDGMAITIRLTPPAEIEVFAREPKNPAPIPDTNGRRSTVARYDGVDPPASFARKDNPSDY